MNPKVPAIVVCSILSLAAGVGLGALGMTGFGYHWHPELSARAASAGAAKGDMAKGGPTKGGGDKGKKGKGPAPRSQLALLVSKLDLLTSKPIYLELPSDTRAKVYEQLQDLTADQELSDDAAKQKLDSLLEVLKDHKETLDAVGFRWPGSGAGGGPTPANPFAEEKAGKQLKGLQQRLQKADTRS